jgi:CheY-like chemotaxis protein
MDVQMPEMDGLEATERIRERELHGKRRTPIVALTAHVLRSDRDRCIAAGMDGYIGKPFTNDDLLAALMKFAPHTH